MSARVFSELDDAGRKLGLQPLVEGERSGIDECPRLLGDRLADAGQLTQVAALADHLFDALRQLPQGGRPLPIGPDGEPRLALHLKQACDVLEDLGYFGVGHGGGRYCSNTRTTQASRRPRTPSRTLPRGVGGEDKTSSPMRGKTEVGGTRRVRSGRSMPASFSPLPNSIDWALSSRGISACTSIPAPLYSRSCDRRHSSTKLTLRCQWLARFPASSLQGNTFLLMGLLPSSLNVLPMCPVYL